MIRFSVIIFALYYAVLGVTATNAQEAQAGKVVIEPYSLKTFDGKEHPSELGRLWVREDREGSSTRLIQLAFVRLKSAAAKPDSPIVFLMGGPGIPGTVMGQVPPYFTLFDKLRENADVILLDQRGTGMSSPNLQCEEKALIPPDMWESRENALREFRRRLVACAAHWKAQGVNLAAYTTNASADDVEDLRRAIGADHISLLSFSYGTELALAMIRRHGDKLHRVVLQGVRAPDMGTTPADRDIQLQRMSYLVATNPNIGSLVPDMMAELSQVLAKFDRGPITITVKNKQTGQPVAISVGKFGFQSWFSASFGGPEIPALLYTMKRGDYSIFTRIIEDVYNGGFGDSLMARAVNCGSRWSAERLSRVKNEAERSPLGDAASAGLLELCDIVGNPDLGPAFRSPISSTIPTLFITGTLDNNTPLYQVEEIRWRFPNSVHVIVENGGHELLPSPTVQSFVVDFFKGQELGKRFILQSRPRFLQVEEAKSR